MKNVIEWDIGIANVQERKNETQTKWALPISIRCSTLLHFYALIFFLPFILFSSRWIRYTFIVLFSLYSIVFNLQPCSMQKSEPFINLNDYKFIIEALFQSLLRFFLPLLHLLLQFFLSLSLFHFWRICRAQWSRWNANQLRIYAFQWHFCSDSRVKYSSFCCLSLSFACPSIFDLVDRERIKSQTHSHSIACNTWMHH